jgi:hypothetical protein
MEQQSYVTEVWIVTSHISLPTGLPHQYPTLMVRAERLFVVDVTVLAGTFLFSHTAADCPALS